MNRLLRTLATLMLGLSLFMFGAGLGLAVTTPAGAAVPAWYARLIAVHQCYPIDQHIDKVISGYLVSYHKTPQRPWFYADAGSLAGGVIWPWATDGIYELKAWCSR